MFDKTKEFLKEVKVETKKVVYPTRDELIGSTWVVIVTVLIMALFLGVVDLSLSKIVKVVLR